MRERASCTDQNEKYNSSSEQDPFHTTDNLPTGLFQQLRGR